MRIIAKKTIKDFWKNSNYRDSEQPLKSWYHEIKEANWKTNHDVKAKYKNVSILKNNRVVFNIAGNKYRLVVVIEYYFNTVYIRFIGTHKEYDKINIETI